MISGQAPADPARRSSADGSPSRARPVRARWPRSSCRSAPWA